LEQEKAAAKALEERNKKIKEEDKKRR